MLDLADLTNALTTDYGGDRNERLNAYVELAITSDPGRLHLTVNHDHGGVEKFDVHITRKDPRPPSEYMRPGLTAHTTAEFAYIEQQNTEASRGA